MTLQYIDLKDLKLTSVNVRKKGGKDVSDLEPSIRSLGLLQPLLVRPNCEGYEIVAGQRRYHALSKIAEDTELEPIPCMVMADGDDAKAIEASLAENVARLPMDEVDQCKAFVALVRQGLELSEIAAQFGITERLVTQRLAIAKLIAPILTAYRRGDIHPRTLRLLTMATKKQQKAWIELFNSEDEFAPDGNALKAWLFGGAHIPVSNALFDLGEYTSNIVSDLFGEEQYFDDAETFWTAQNGANSKMKAGYEADGWGEVVLLEVGAFFPNWDYADVSKEDGGRVIIEVSRNGEVTAHEGKLTLKEKRARDRRESGEVEAPKAKPELTQPMQRYLALHRHAAVRNALLSHAGVALRLAAAQIIAGSELWEVSAEPQKANSEAVEASLSTSKAEAAFAKERQAIRALLGLDGQEGESVVPKKHDWSATRDLHAIFAKLLTLSDDEVMLILTFVASETLPCGSAMVEALGQMFEVDMREAWEPDDAYFDLLRDKEVINAMLKEVGGKAAADGNVTATAKVQKKVIRDYLGGIRTGGKENWLPRHMAFPMKAYTKRGGNDAMDAWKAVRKHYA